MAEKVVLAIRDATVHISTGEPQNLTEDYVYEPHDSRVLKAGETISPNELTTYLRKMVEKGEIEGLALLTEFQAKKRLRDARLAQGDLSVLEEESSLEEEKTE